MARRNVVSIRDARRAREAASSGPSSRFTAAELKAMSIGEVLEVFRTLEAPDLGEMDGEFVATLLDQGGPAMNVISSFTTNVPRRWLGKAFEPVDPSEGHGYNWFQGAGHTVRRYRMKTYLGESAVDAGRSYILEYRPYNSGFMRSMVDEVRRVAPGLYVGLGRVGFGSWMRTRLYPFMLEGPVGPYSDPG
ncbi:MAG: hypothetical protein IPK07_14985 [Deltaproteobacteria bacterium]|jgi:hypothetical protein|nr:hypothetical protein [Deltaproteobacteria bacterium]